MPLFAVGVQLPANSRVTHAANVRLLSSGYGRYGTDAIRIRTVGIRRYPIPVPWAPVRQCPLLSEADTRPRSWNVRFGPVADIAPLYCRRGRAATPNGKASALAVLRLISISSFVGCSSGRALLISYHIAPDPGAPVRTLTSGLRHVRIMSALPSKSGH